MGHQYQPPAAGLAGDIQVVNANGRPLLFQNSPDVAIVGCGSHVVGQHFQAAAEILDDRQIADRVAALFSAPCMSSARVMADMAMRPW